MTLSDDKNVLRCYCSFVFKDQLWLVTQYMDKGSCLRVMTLTSEVFGLGKGLSEESVAYILRETLQGLQYLHANGQIHRDIKCGNILVDSVGNVRLADFGVSGWTLSRGQRRENVRTFVGTPCWMVRIVSFLPLSHYRGGTLPCLRTLNPLYHVNAGSRGDGTGRWLRSEGRHLVHRNHGVRVGQRNGTLWYVHACLFGGNRLVLQFQNKRMNKIESVCSQVRPDASSCFDH